jgi:hypothetical protein
MDMNAKASIATTAKEPPLVIDFLVHVAESPDIYPFGVVDPIRERQDNHWLDLLMARRVGDPWLVRIGERGDRAPHLRVPTPEEEAREARGGMAAPCTRVGLVYANRLRAHMHVRQLVRHVEGLFLVLDMWKRFFPVVSREVIPWFAKWREREFRSDELTVSENWAIGGLDPSLAARVKTLLSQPPIAREKPAGHPAEEPRGDENWPRQQPAPERIVMGAPSNCTPFRVEGGANDGVAGIICSRGRQTKQKPCITCGKPGAWLCDAPLGTTKKTCSAPLCDACTTKRDGKDLCAKHAANAATSEAKQQPTKNAGQLGFF